MILLGDHVWGYKALIYDTTEKVLKSPSYKMEWPKGEIIKAVCSRYPEKHTDPPYSWVDPKSEYSCACGIHATWDLDIAYKYVRSDLAFIIMMEAGPKIIVQEKGFRASHVKPILISCPPPTHRSFRPGMYYMAQAVSEEYGLPYMDWDDLMLCMNINNVRVGIKTYPIQKVRNVLFTRKELEEYDL